MSLKTFSWLLLVAILSVTLSGAYEHAHAMQRHVSELGSHASQAEASVSHTCPCAPLEQHNDYDGCDTCVNCTCHASLVVQPFQLAYCPVVLNLNTSDPFRFLPEVYLSRFIPPQKHV